MPVPINDIKKKHLEDRLVGLKEEYEAASRQLGQVLDARERIIIQRQIDGLEDEIQRIENELKEVAPPPERTQVSVQVAVVAMTNEQAKNLETVVPPDEREHLQALKDALREYEVEDFTSCYDDSRDEWKPLIADREMSIREIIQDVVDKLNRDSEGIPGQPVICPEYLSDRFFSPKNEERANAWGALAEGGGILIVDAVSMYHPTLRGVLLNSQLMSLIAMIVLSPLKSNAIPVNKLLEAQIYTSHLEWAFGHFINNPDSFYEFGVGDICNLRRWLFSILKNVKKQGLSPEVRAAIHAETGLIPRGLGNLIVGSW